VEVMYLIPFTSLIIIAIPKGCAFTFIHIFLTNPLITNINQGDGTPDSEDFDPAALHAPGKKRVSTAQFVPRTSKEMQKHSYEYQILHEGLEPVFKWVESVVFYLFIFTIISMLNLSF